MSYDNNVYLYIPGGVDCCHWWMLLNNENKQYSVIWSLNTTMMIHVNVYTVARTLHLQLLRSYVTTMHVLTDWRRYGTPVQQPGCLNGPPLAAHTVEAGLTAPRAPFIVARAHTYSITATRPHFYYPCMPSSTYIVILSKNNFTNKARINTILYRQADDLITYHSIWYFTITFLVLQT